MLTCKHHYNANEDETMNCWFSKTTHYDSFVEAQIDSNGAAEVNIKGKAPYLYSRIRIDNPVFKFYGSILEITGYEKLKDETFQKITVYVTFQKPE